VHALRTWARECADVYPDRHKGVLHRLARGSHVTRRSWGLTGRTLGHSRGYHVGYRSGHEGVRKRHARWSRVVLGGSGDAQGGLDRCSDGYSQAVLAEAYSRCSRGALEGTLRYARVTTGYSRVRNGVVLGCAHARTLTARAHTHAHRSAGTAGAAWTARHDT
jgi:hypothetical protein